MSAETTRRDLLAGAALVGVPDVVPFLRKAKTTSVGTDAELLAMGQEWRESVACCDDADRRYLAAEERYERPDEPEAVYWRKSDLAIFGQVLGREEIVRKQPTGRRRLDHPALLAFLACEVAAMRLYPAYLRDADYGRRLDRMTEILQAESDWSAECTRRWQAAGLDVAEDLSGLEHTRNSEIRARIIQTPARTMAGIALKVQVTQWCFGESSIEAEEAAVGSMMDGSTAAENLSVSIVIDLMRMARAGALPT